MELARPSRPSIPPLLRESNEHFLLFLPVSPMSYFCMYLGAGSFMPIQADPEFQFDFLSPSAFSSEESTNAEQDAELVEDLLQFLTPTRSHTESLASFENERMQRYRTWFAQSSQANRSSVAARDYARSASKTILPDGREISTFAPFRPDLSALQTFTPAQLLTIGALLLLWIAGVACFHLMMLSATIAAITILYTFMLGGS
jgi:hypothetical protein